MNQKCLKPVVGGMILLASLSAANIGEQSHEHQHEDTSAPDSYVITLSPSMSTTSSVISWAKS